MILFRITIRRLFDIANDIELDYGSFSFIKQIPNAVWGDTIKTHKTSGNKVSINDMYFIVRQHRDSLSKVSLDEGK